MSQCGVEFTRKLFVANVIQILTKKKILLNDPQKQ